MKNLVFLRQSLSIAVWLGASALAGCAAPTGERADDQYQVGDAKASTGSHVVRRDRAGEAGATRQVDKDSIELGRAMPAAKPGS